MRSSSATHHLPPSPLCHCWLARKVGRSRKKRKKNEIKNNNLSPDAAFHKRQDAHTHIPRTFLGLLPVPHTLPFFCTVWVFGLTSSFSSVSPVYARFLLSLEKCYYVPLALLAKLALPSYAVPPMPRHACHASPPAAAPPAPAALPARACTS